MEATWPPAAVHHGDGWVLREGQGGGKRVSSCSATRPVDEAAIHAAETAMAAIGQRALFMLNGSEGDLDGQLEAKGYACVDPVALYAAPVSQLCADLPPLCVFDLEEPLSIMLRLWSAGGIGPERMAVMARAKGPKTYLFGRNRNRAAAVAFAALDGPLVMLHALEVAPDHRREGVGRAMLTAAANWAASHGATELGLAVTRANTPANALYAAMGLEVVGGYHYRCAP
ncbi:GNAT family N-acetyltransferase [Poseidonocella pacifica]|nr:GNAT family N-acetyltransferase [Poseidonocella pacifica]